MSSRRRAPTDLRAFLQALRETGELAVIDAPVRAHLEIAEIADRISKAPTPTDNKALLFTRVDDSAMPLLINAFGSHNRMLAALGVDHYEAIQARMLGFLKPPTPANWWDKLLMLPKLAELNRFLPKLDPGPAPCQQVILADPARPMLDALPILQCWPQDGGPFITLGCVIVKDPASGERNVGMYRLQKYDNVTTGMHWQKHHDGARLYEAARRLGRDRLEAAVVIGPSPAVTYSATAPLPPGIDELLLAGFLQDAPVRLTRCRTIDLEVPADAEIVLEGYVLLDERRREGPFGDHTGYYSEADDYPVFHVSAVTHRRDAIYQTTIVGKPRRKTAIWARPPSGFSCPCCDCLSRKSWI